MERILRAFRRLLGLAGLATVLQAASTAAAGQLVYDLNRDWSTNQNPSGVWSYNQNDTPISVYQTFWWGEAGWGYLEIGDGCMIKGSAPSGTDPWGNVVPPPHDWLPGDVMMHALSLPYGGGSTFLNVKWTSPAEGTIDISGQAWDGEIFLDRDVSWTLSVGGQVIAQRTSVRGLYRTDPGAQFSGNLVGHNRLTGIRVKQGEVVEFRVAATTYYGHFVGIQEQVTLHTSSNQLLAQN